MNPIGTHRSSLLAPALATIVTMGMLTSANPATAIPHGRGHQAVTTSNVGNRVPQARAIRIAPPYRIAPPPQQYRGPGRGDIPWHHHAPGVINPPARRPPSEDIVHPAGKIVAPPVVRSDRPRTHLTQAAPQDLASANAKFARAPTMASSRPQVLGAGTVASARPMASQQGVSGLPLDQLLHLPKEQLRGVTPEKAASLERYRDAVRDARRYDAEAQVAQRKAQGLEKLVDKGQAGLAAAGMIPVVGTAADLLNATISAGRGDRAGAAFSAAAAIPIVGDLAGTVRVGRAATKAVENSAEALTRTATAGGESAAEKSVVTLADRGAQSSRMPMDMTALKSGIAIGTDPVVRSAVMRVKPTRGYFDVIAHGNATQIGVVGGRMVPPGELANAIKAHPAYKGQDVCLLSCSTGQLPNGYASRLAKELGNGRHVVAPTDKLHITPKGGLIIGPNKWDPTGHMQIFYPPR